MKAFGIAVASSIKFYDEKQKFTDCVLPTTNLERLEKFWAFFSKRVLKKKVLSRWA